MEEDIKEDIKKALDVLRSGGVILYPTDTVWGLGCDATDSGAVEKIYKIKGRSESKSMLSLVDSIPMLERYTGALTEIAEQLIEVADRPLTIVYDNVRGLAPELTGEDGSAGLRITSERFSKELCRRFGRAIVSTSANLSGAAAPAIFKAISPEILAAADYVVGYRQDDTAAHAPSSVIRLAADGTIKILRP